MAPAIGSNMRNEQTELRISLTIAFLGCLTLGIALAQLAGCV